MRIRLSGRQRAADAGRAQEAKSAPERPPMTWARTHMRERIQRAEAVLGPAIEPARRRTHEPEHSPLADRGRTADDLSTPEGQAYARAFSDTAAAYVKELRERDPLPEPDRTPGALHPDPFLASRGWHVNKHGIYTRRAEPESQAPLKHELEAGS